MSGYTIFGIEKPFPWKTLLLLASPILAGGLTLGAMLAVLIFGGDALIEHLAEW